MDAGGGNQTRLTRNDAADTGAAWSPDGSKIAFAGNRSKADPFNYDIYVMNADGSAVERIVSDPELGPQATRTAWSRCSYTHLTGDRLIPFDAALDLMY